MLVQVAGTVLPMFGAPDWLPRSVVILLAIGLLPTLVFAWVFEMTSKFDPASGNSLEGYDMPLVLVLLGENALALDYVERLAGELGGTADWAVMLPALDPIRCEPRFIAVVERLKTTDPHAEKVCAGKH